METATKGKATAERLCLWQVEGAHVPEATSAHDILSRAGLDWDVELKDIYVDGVDGGERVSGGHRQGIVRKDTHQILGVAKSRYVPFGNVEVMSFLDQLVDDGSMLFEAAWSWRDGETVGIAMRLPETIKIAGFDEHSMNMLVRTSHDGGGSLVCAATPVRIACTNEVTATIRGANHVWKLRHTQSLAGKIASAREALAMTFAYGSAWDDEVQKMLDTPTNTTKVKAVAAEIFGETKAEMVVDRWKTIADIADFRETRYGAYNAMTDFAQWVAPRGTPSLESAMRGTIARQSDRAYQLLSV